MERKSKTKEIGDLGEKHVAALLKKQGFRIIGRNVRLSYKEIDIIAEDEKYIKNITPYDITNSDVVVSLDG